jgi:hypothetical protein
MAQVVEILPSKHKMGPDFKPQNCPKKKKVEVQ